MYSMRADFDSYLHWGVFIFISVFMTYFVMSMISLASAEEEQGGSVASISYTIRSSHMGHQGTSTLELIEEEYQ